MAVPKRLLALLVGVPLALSACSTDSEGDQPAAEEGGGGGGDGDLSFAVVTHGSAGDAFWDVVQKGSDAAAEDLGVEVDYQSDGDPQRQAQLIDAAVNQGVDGIVVSMANPDALQDSIEAAVAADIPVITINSGADDSATFGAIGHVGQDETIAGVGAGQRLKADGATTVLCVIHEAGNIGLEQRCDGASQGLGSPVQTLQVDVNDLAAAQSTITSQLQTGDVDAVLTLNSGVAQVAAAAVGDAGSQATVATFDLNSDVISGIQDGTISFAVDQQQYEQGYLPIVMLKLYVDNANTVGGGQPVLTGPGIVDQSNVEQIAELASSGTRRTDRRAAPRGTAAPGTRQAAGEGEPVSTSTAAQPGAARSPSPSSSPPDERIAKVGLLRRLLVKPELGALIGALVIFAFFALQSSVFRGISGVANWLDPASTIGIMAIAVALLMIGGHFDLSAGVMTGTTALTVGICSTELGLNIWAAIGVALVIALAIGFLNGFLVVRTGLPSFIITLGTFLMLQGLNLGLTKIFTGTVTVGGIKEAGGYGSAEMVFASTISIAGQPFRIAIVWWVLFTALATYVLLRTRFGNWVFATGGDEIASRNVGVPAARTTITLFMTTSAAAWFVGTVIAVRYTSVQANQGIGLELIYIVAAVIGGCLLTGGFGSAVGASLGALIFGMTQQGIVYLRWEADWFYFFLGAMLLLAVMANRLVRRFAEARR